GGVLRPRPSSAPTYCKLYTLFGYIEDDKSARYRTFHTMVYAFSKSLPRSLFAAPMTLRLDPAAARPGSVDRVFSLRNDPLEAQALAFGHQGGDRAGALAVALWEEKQLKNSNPGCRCSRNSWVSRYGAFEKTTGERSSRRERSSGRQTPSPVPA